MPRANAGDLMLRDDVLRAAADGRFSVWAMDTVDQGLELLTGSAAGTPGRDGKFPAGTVHAAVQARLRELSRAQAAAPTAGPSAVRYREKPAPSAQTSVRVRQRED
jgi:predicted ATP-dependent protease